MNIFQEMKERVTARQVAERYGLKVRRNGMACCPFHNDKHPSMKINQNYYCFACGAKGDAVNYVAVQFGLSQFEAAKKINEDFSLGILIGQPEIRRKQNSGVRKKEKVPTKEERIQFVQKKIDKWASGGNGAVYDVEFEGDEGFEFPIVAKFFEYGGVDKEKRYNRFKNEIIALNALKGIEGIMEVIDKQCPHVVPQTKDEAWYLMPKAKPYKLNRKRNIYSKILEMLQLARIIQSIHERDKAHRDIKPENILVLNGKLVLSDFGLCWGIGEERLTGLNERVGPYKIMPPELERVQTDLDLDFKPSDVYLFSKVLWMTLKGDNIGFRGQYQRGEVQIYLNKEDYDNVITLEPIHKLMEEATFEEMGKRISIQKCIEYLELQRKILNREEYELLSNEFVSQLLYDEYSKKIIACSKPDELTYKDAAIITHMLRDIIPISNIFVKSLHSDQNIKQIQITDFQVGMDGICKLLYYNKGIKIKEYLLNISKMNYSNYSSVISLELNDISLVDEGYIAYSAAGHGFGNEYPRVYFSSGEKIIIKRKENL